MGWKIFAVVAFTNLIYNIAWFGYKQMHRNIPRMQSLIKELTDRYANDTPVPRIQMRYSLNVMPRNQHPTRMADNTGEHSTYLTKIRKDLKIFSYNLSAKFNWDIVDQFVEKRDRFDMSNGGYGTVLNITHGLSIRNTRQNSLDEIFYDRLMKSNLITVNPEKADMFYIPYFHDMAIGNTSSTMTKYLFPELNKLPFYKLHKPHFMMIGWPCILVKRDIALLTANISFITLENANGFENFPKTIRPMIVAPYPSFGHFTKENGGEWTHRLFINKRPVSIFISAKNRRRH